MGPPGYMLLCLKMETEPASETCFFKKLDDGKITKKEIVSVNFRHALFSFLDFLDLEARTDRLFHNIGMDCCLISLKSAILT